MSLPATYDFNNSGSDQSVTSLSSNFTIVNGDIYAFGANDNGAAWTPSTVCAVRWNVDLPNNDQYSQVVVSNLPNTYQQGAGVRMQSGAASFYYFMVCYQAGWNDRIGKVIAGTNTNLGTTASDNAVNNDVIRIEASGTTLTPKINGSTTNTPGAQTDSALSSGYVGFMGNGNGSSSVVRMDDWEGGNLSSGTNYTQSISGAISTLTGAAVKRGNKVTSGQLSVISGTVNERLSRALSGAVSTITGGLVKRGEKVISGQLSVISGTVTSIRSILRSLSGSVGTITGGLVKQGSKVTSGQLLVISGTVSRRLGRAISGQLSVISGTVTSIRSILRSLSGSVGTITGGLVKQGSKVTSGQLSVISGTVSRRLSRALSGAVGTITGSVIKQARKIIVGSIAVIEGVVATIHTVASSIRFGIATLSDATYYDAVLSDAAYCAAVLSDQLIDDADLEFTP
jgi:formylmethanofuran:tetrahydromethanopterin formyltransferase